MVEVFKTDVYDARHAAKLIELIHKNFSEYEANFDLEDCDKILRIRSKAGTVQPALLITMLKRSGFNAEVLPD